MKLEVDGGVAPFEAQIRLPGDKSIAHRAAMFSILSDRSTTIRAYPTGQDNLTTLSVMEELGMKLDPIRPGLMKMVPPREVTRDLVGPLDCMNSGTTARLMSGLLAGLQVPARLIGDRSLSSRPMDRVAVPLRKLGADIRVTGKRGTLPLEVHPKALRGARVLLEVASAQVKSALLLAGLYAEGLTRVDEPFQSRDHTERLLKHMGAEISFGARYAEISGMKGALAPLDLTVPGDPSSAAVWVVLAACVEGSDLIIEDLLLNPTRMGFISILRRMGADIEVLDRRPMSGETIGHLRVRGRGLKGVKIRGSEVPAAIDELPVLAVAMACAEGVSSLHGAEELRLKESDRLRAIVEGLQRFGIAIEETIDGFILEGGPMKGAAPLVYGDHRLVMAFAVAGALAEGRSLIRDADVCAISYPEFCEDLAAMGVFFTTS